MKRNRTVDKKVLDAFAQEFTFCWACGWGGGSFTRRLPWRDWHIPKLDIAHIIGGSGRHHTRENITRICAGCHRLFHGDRIKVHGKYLPQLTLSNLLWLKLVFDPVHYCRGYLKDIRQRAVPRASIPKAWFQEEFLRNTGLAHYAYKCSLDRRVSHDRDG